MITMKVTGFAELERALRQLPNEIAGKVMASALRTAGEPAVEAAKAKAPRSDEPGPHGHMADSIKLRKLHGASDLFETEVAYWFGPAPEHFYGSFVEFGTRFQAATPFMRPAWDEHKAEILKTFGDVLGAAIERAATKLAK